MSHSLYMTLAERNSDTPWSDKGFAYAYLVASRLTDPLSQAHQYYRQTLIVDTLYPTASTFEKRMRKMLLLGGSLSHSFFALFTTLPGIEIRSLAHALQKKPYLYFKGGSEEKKFAEKSFSLLSWNLCGVSGGYSITDGGVLPWRYRIVNLAEQLLSQDADVICLYEIFDIQTAFCLIKELKHSYGHFYFHIGPNPVGLSSGLCIASKVRLANPEFIPFPQNTFDGRAKHCKKGFFSFDVQNDCKTWVRIYTTHLQHSEVPANPTDGEIYARREAMKLILAHMQKASSKACVLTGDLNLEEKEFHASEWSAIFDKGTIKESGYTWGGDQFCSKLVGKPTSDPLNLDHTIVTKNAGARVVTSYIQTGFDGTLFKPEALSDHKGLLSIITFED